MTSRMLEYTVPAADPGAGVDLATDVHLPPGPGPWPAVVIRTPYDRTLHRREGAGWARRGIAAVVQDVRGRYGSTGRWQPYADERRDGVAVLAWLQEQQWWDGRAVAYGASYAAGTAWALAVEAAAAGTPLRGVVSMVPVLGLGPVKFEPCGVLRLAEHLSWWAEHGDGDRSRPGAAADVARTRPRLAWHLPLTGIPDVVPELFGSGWSNAVLTGRDGHPLTATDTELADVARAGTATLHVGGWRDLMVTETLRHHARTAEPPAAPTSGHPRGTDPEAVPGSSSLVIGPWGHDLGGLTEPCGTDRTPLGAFMARWVAAALDGTAAAEVRIADLTTSRWSAPPRWPPPAVEAPMTCLSTSADAQPDGATQAGAPPERALIPLPMTHDGRSPTGEACRFMHDPADPHPSTAVGAARRHPPRSDAVRWSTQPLVTAFTVDGAPVVHLRAGADGPADWVVRLLHRYLDGTEVLLARAMLSDLADVDTGVALGAVRATVPAGNRLVLEVSGADFPHAARALGGTDPDDRYIGTVMQPIVQTVHAGLSGTRLDLPLTRSESQPPAPTAKGPGR